MSRQLLAHLAVLAFLLCMGAAVAEDDEQVVDVEVVYSSTKTDVPADELTESVSVIGQDEIEQSSAVNVVDLLKEIPGVEVVQTGSVGSTVSIFMRGGNSSHTLVLVDGIKINSPTTGAVDLCDMTLDGIRRIEIVRGPMGTLYGSEAMTGVIQIFTAAGPQVEDHVRLGAGSDGIALGSFAYGTGEGETGFSLSGSWRQADGFHFERDDYDGFTAAARYDARAAGGIITLTGRYSDYDKSLYGFPYLPEDPNRVQSSESLIAGLAWNRYGDDAHTRVQVSYFDSGLTDDDPENAAGAGNTYTDIDATVTGIELQHDWYKGRNTFTLGAEYLQREADYAYTDAWSNDAYDESNDNTSVFGQWQLRGDGIDFTAAARYDDNENFGSDTNFRLGIGGDRASDQLRWWANYATAFRAPSLNELYYPNWGDPDIEPESSKGYEIGLWQGLGEDASVQLVYFHNDFDDLIATIATDDPAYTWGSKAGNINNATTEGCEFIYTSQLSDLFSHELSITRMNTWTDSTTPLIRRPEMSGSYRLAYHDGRTAAAVRVGYTGERWDNDYNGPPWGTGRGLDIWGRYWVVNLEASHALTDDGTELWLRVNNVLDDEYEAVAGYPAPDLHFYGGIKKPL